MADSTIKDSKNLSKTFTELESDDFSLETPSEPTDFSISPDVSEVHEKKKSGRITRQLLERKQLAHDVQLLKIEQSQKTLLIDNLKVEHMQKMEEMEEKLTDALHQKQLLQARLEAQINIQKDESRRRQDSIRQEMETILDKQRKLEVANQKLSEKAGHVRQSLAGDLLMDEDQYFEIRDQDDADLSLKTFVSKKLYEAVNPLKVENEALRSKYRQINDDVRQFGEEVDQLQEQLSTERREHGELQVKYQKLVLELADTKGLVKHGEYRIENYDRTKSERDDLDQELLELKQRFAYLDASNTSTTRERDDLLKDLATTKQSLALMTQDKDYLSKQVDELHNRLSYSDERLHNVTNELDFTKKAREEMYEKYINSREQYKSEYECKLQEELEKIRVRTNGEIDRLKTGTREMYERENRNLREARDLALSEKDRAIVTERDAVNKHDQLLADFRQLQISGDNRSAELQNDLKIKSFELERTQLVYEETVRNLKEVQLDHEKVQLKFDVLTKEFYHLQNSTQRKITELETTLTEKAQKLETYEKLEQELDDVVMQAAEIENEDDAERVLFSYGYGANVPSTAKRRLKQSVQLARRVLQLERANTSLRNEIEREKTKTRQLGDELKNTNNILDQAQQPYNYLIESIRVRDTQVQQQKKHIDTLEEDVRHLDKDKAESMRVRNQMAADLERLLNQREEMTLMKQIVLNMSDRREQPSRGPRTPRTKPAHSTFDRPEENVQKPGAHIFINNEQPNWYKKLQQKTETPKYAKVYGVSS
ncbi:progesterone-induced-blocking factor 1-like [Lineus longissimus]|uniref:progesterone-induced-blocking factor 1-like n=1 Tax=Lineus longissimus TaxID=88925 RepID=UPI00315CC692